MSSEERKKVIVIVYYPRDDYVLQLHDTLRRALLPNDFALLLNCNVHEDWALDDYTLTLIDATHYNLYFLGAVGNFGAWNKTDRKVFDDNVAFMTRRYKHVFPMFKYDTEEYKEITQEKVEKAIDIMFQEFKKLFEYYIDVMDVPIPHDDADVKRFRKVYFKETPSEDEAEAKEEDKEEKKGEDADSETETDSETEPEKEKEKQDDVTPEKEKKKEEPEAKKIKTSEEN